MIQTMEQVNVHEAKTHLSKLLARVAMGEEITIAKAGRPIARLVPVPPPREPRKPGSGRGTIIMRDNFDDPVPGFEEFYK